MESDKLNNKKSRRTHNALGQFLIEAPMGAFCPPELADVQTRNKPLFDSATELASLMPLTNDKSGVSQILAGMHTPRATKQRAIASAIKQKLAKYPKAAELMIDEMAQIIDAVKHWPKDKGQSALRLFLPDSMHAVSGHSRYLVSTKKEASESLSPGGVVAPEKKLRRVHNALGELLLDQPFGEFCPEKMASPETRSKPLFQSATELISFMPAGTDKSGMSKILAGITNPSPDRQKAIEGAIRKKLSREPEAAELLVGHMSALIQALKNWPKPEGTPVHAVLVPITPPAMKELFQNRAKSQARSNARKPQTLTLVMPPREIQEAAFADLKRAGVRPKDIDLVTGSNKPIDFETYIANRLTPTKPGAHGAKELQNRKKVLHEALVKLTPMPS